MFRDVYSAVVVGKAYCVAIDAAVRTEFGGGGITAAAEEEEEEEKVGMVSISGMKKEELGVKEFRVGVLGTSKSGRFKGSWEGRT